MMRERIRCTHCERMRLARCFELGASVCRACMPAWRRLQQVPEYARGRRPIIGPSARLRALMRQYKR